MREYVRTCDLCGCRIKSYALKVKTEINLGYVELDICHKCERHMVQYIINARKKEADDEE